MAESDDQVLELLVQERRRIVADLADLTPAQWATPSLCEGWTVHDVLAHLTVLPTSSLITVAAAIARSFGNIDRAIASLTAARAKLPNERLLRDLDELAASRATPPGAGLRAPLTDVLIHGEDVRRPLGMTGTAPDAAWRHALEFLCGPRSLGFVPRGRTRGRSFRATDVDWSWGTGAEVVGPAASLAMALTGRPAGLADLEGDGTAGLLS